MATHSSILAGRTQGRRSLANHSLWGHQESDTTEHLSTHLGKHQEVNFIFSPQTKALKYELVTGFSL